MTLLTVDQAAERLADQTTVHPPADRRATHHVRQTRRAYHGIDTDDLDAFVTAGRVDPASS